MNTKIFEAVLSHVRFEPLRYGFSYPVLMYYFDLDQLNHAQKLPFFGYNRFALLSIYDRDYLSPDDRSITEKVKDLLKTKNTEEEVQKFYLLTCPRFLNYVFNPISFIFCCDSNNDIKAIVAEVHNTFNEKHIYLLNSKNGREEDGELNHTVAKEFYVSPFFTVDGQYQFSFHATPSKMKIKIDLNQNEKRVFSAKLTGKFISYQDRAFWLLVFKYPFKAVATMPRIIWQAAILYYQKHLTVKGRIEQL